MANVRRRKSRRKAKINTTQSAKKLKRKYQPKVQFELKSIRESWNPRRTLKQNLSSLGLAYDANSSVPLRPMREEGEQQVFGNVGDYTTEKRTKREKEESSQAVAVIQEMKELSSKNSGRKAYHMSLCEAKFVADLIRSHGSDYQKMMRDKRNYNQLTENQLKNKCKQFHLSPHVTLLQEPDSAMS